MTPKTFHPFLRLPKEIQLEIWTHAILQIPNTFALLDQFFFTQKPWQWRAYHRPHLSITTLGPTRLSIHCLVSHSVKNLALRSLGNLFCTSVMAREVALEWWRDVVEDWEWEDTFVKGYADATVTREGLLDVLSGCIRGLQGR